MFTCDVQILIGGEWVSVQPTNPDNSLDDAVIWGSGYKRAKGKTPTLRVVLNDKILWGTEDITDCIDD